MRPIAVAALLALAAARPLAAADDPLARARQLYNQHEYEAAVAAAEQARLAPARADAADLVAARAYLERFRTSAVSDDLTNARDRLRRIDPQHLPPRERLEYVVGLGEALFLDDQWGAAAAVFDSVLLTRDLVDAEARDRALDWWATSLDRDARPRSDIDRQPVYQHIRARMQEEIAAHPASATAAYWLAAAARAQGDLQTAWSAAEAAWVRSALAVDHGVALRDDVDRLVVRGLVPDRAKATSQPPDALRMQWEQFKERWKQP
jgi:hypothetical protein